MNLLKFGAGGAFLVCVVVGTPGWAATAIPSSTLAVCQATTPDLAGAYALSDSGSYASAQVKFQSRLEVEQSGEHPDPATVSCLLHMIGYMEYKQRRPDQALSWFERALQPSPLPPAVVALVKASIGSAYLELGQLDRAEETAAEAIRLTERVFGPGHPETLYPQNLMAGIHLVRGDFVRAEPVCRRILSQLEREVVPDPYAIAVAATNLGQVYFYQGRHSLARDLFQKAIRGLRNSPDKVDEILLTEAAVMLTYASEGRSHEANALLNRLLPSAENVLGSEHPSLALFLERAAAAKFLLKEPEAGRQMYDRAISILEGQNSPELAPCLRRYAATLHASRDKRRAKEIEARLALLP